jgi:hypothetical protein
MHGASLHRRHRFRGVLHIPWPEPAVRLAKAASRPGLPHALIRCAHPTGSLRLSICLRRSSPRCASVPRRCRVRVSAGPKASEANNHLPSVSAIDARHACHEWHLIKGSRRQFWRSGHPSHATASWSAAAEMHGASLHRRHRFRGVLSVPRPHPAVRPAKAASRQGLPHALIRFAHPSGSLRLSIFAALRFQDAVAFA